MQHHYVYMACCPSHNSTFAVDPRETGSAPPMSARIFSRCGHNHSRPFRGTTRPTSLSKGTVATRAVLAAIPAEHVVADAAHPAPLFQRRRRRGVPRQDRVVGVSHWVVHAPVHARGCSRQHAVYQVWPVCREARTLQWAEVP